MGQPINRIHACFISGIKPKEKKSRGLDFISVMKVLISRTESIIPYKHKISIVTGIGPE